LPVVFREKGYHFSFHSNEGNPRERVHVHVARGDGLAKVWVDPEVRMAKAYGFTAAELREVERIVAANRSTIQEKWHEHFGD